MNSDKVIGMCDDLKAEFGEDYPIVASKFYMQQANLAFVYQKYEDAEKAVTHGLDLVKQVDTKDEEIQRASNHTHRDLLNLHVRLTSRKEKKDAQELRKQVAEEHGFKGTTFMNVHDEKAKKLEEVHEQLQAVIK